MFSVDLSDDSLLGDLCQLYLDHPQYRKEITSAADRIEMMLRTSADRIGAEVSVEGLRKFRYEPLEVIYSIDSSNVEIQTARWVGHSTT